MTHLIEYGYQCQLLGKENEKWKVKITKEDEIIERLVSYEPVEDKWEFDERLVQRKNEYGTLKKYTVYEKDNKLVRAYHFCGVKRFSDDLVYEYEVGNEVLLVEENPFLLPDEIEELEAQRYDEKKNLKEEKENIKKRLSEIENSLKEIDKKYDIENKCFHQWEFNYEEEINDGKTTKKVYECPVCGKVDEHYWHKLF